MSDRPSRVERVLNLLAALLDASRPLTRPELTEQVFGYPSDPDNCRRAFERDKETLRAMGVPIAVTTLADGVEQGYRVVPSEYYLPELDLTEAETAALRVALSAVALGSGDRAGSGALRKLGLGESADLPPIAALPLAPALPALFDAVRRQATVTFEYRGTTRTVEPHRLSSTRGQWYLEAFDPNRGALRTFRADRIDEHTVTVGPGGEFDPPPTDGTRAQITEEPWLFGEGPLRRAQVWVERGHQAGIEAHAERVIERDGRGTTFEVLYTDLEAFRSFLLGFLDHAEVMAPDDLRRDVVAWLRTIVGASKVAS